VARREGRTTVADQVTADDGRAFLLARTDTGLAGNSVASDHRGVRAFYIWAVGDGIVATDPTAKVHAPKFSQPAMPVSSDDEREPLFAACDCPAFLDRRDAAILRLLADTGMRRAEVVALQAADVDVAQRVALVRRGKGGKGRVVAFSAKTALALDRHLSMRKGQRQPASDALWLG